MPVTELTAEDIQHLADIAANDADELLAQLCRTVAQHVLPKVGWDGAFTGCCV